MFCTGFFVSPNQKMQTRLKQILMLSLLLLGLPLLGVMLNDMPLAPYFEFPPRTRHVIHAGFSWPIFILTAAVGVLLMVGIIWIIRRDLGLRRLSQAKTSRHWPWWGWLGLLVLIVSWILAWNRFPWFAPWQWATFTPLWLGYIVVINAWTWRRDGKCLLINQRRYFLMLFPLSALFWWYFEYLNRFVQNWYYIGVDDFGPLRYTLNASLSFSTVLPAVLSTQQWLASVLRIASRPLTLTVDRKSLRRLSWVTLLASSGVLVLLGIWPNLLFPFLWFAPLLVLLALQGIDGEPDLITALRAHGWQLIALSSLAALQCGFFWEMWNYYSATKWIYTVPLVHHFQVFEMPVAGYAGYLPFGIECLVIALLLRRS
ncbi:MAG: hypothetical protein LJE83_13070 [Gammaproteobacteria bacterium]|jgi:hypothetical protein|nr:hypothetical protein [Gammaproteobacteria bacterium]